MPEERKKYIKVEAILNFSGDRYHWHEKHIPGSQTVVVHYERMKIEFRSTIRSIGYAVGFSNILSDEVVHRLQQQTDFETLQALEDKHEIGEKSAPFIYDCICISGARKNFKYIAFLSFLLYFMGVCGLETRKAIIELFYITDL